jgi:hypothetical protein
VDQTELVVNGCVSHESGCLEDWLEYAGDQDITDEGVGEFFLPVGPTLFALLEERVDPPKNAIERANGLLANVYREFVYTCASPFLSYLEITDHK